MLQATIDVATAIELDRIPTLMMVAGRLRSATTDMRTKSAKLPAARNVGTCRPMDQNILPSHTNHHQMKRGAQDPPLLRHVRPE